MYFVRRRRAEEGLQIDDDVWNSFVWTTVGWKSVEFFAFIYGKKGLGDFNDVSYSKHVHEETKWVALNSAMLFDKAAAIAAITSPRRSSRNHVGAKDRRGHEFFSFRAVHFSEIVYIGY